MLLRAQVMGGRVAAALAAYASTRERLADELGTDPSPETEALQLAILRGELAPPGPAAAPASLGLVGRDDELGYLDAVALRARGASADGSAGVEVVVIDGEAGIGKTTLLRSWADRRAAGGDTVLMAACRPLDRALPLDAVLTGLAGLLRRLGPEAAADLLGGDEPLLGPLLAPARAGPARPALADSLLGPAVLYAALVRVLGRLTARGPVVVAIDDAHLAGPRSPTGCASCGAGACRWPWRPPPGRAKASPCRPPG